MWRGVTAVSTLRGNLTVICECKFKKIRYIFFNSHFPNIISIIFFFSKLLPESPRIHAGSRNSKNIQGFVNTLDIRGSL